MKHNIYLDRPNFKTYSLYIILFFENMQFFRCRAGAPARPLILCFCAIFEALGFMMLLVFLYSKKVKSIINPNTVKSSLHQNLSQYTQYIYSIYISILWQSMAIYAMCCMYQID